ncbi:MAG TPA: DNA alkylation repair protein [Gemmatimonadaceae bacterium]|jgi:3-methyladenine DNA glycosylase AlkD|nr:DNA alkylation repair protein [Gemmatimonadaceae bacterium]
MTATRDRVENVLATLERRGTKHTRDGYARYGITVTKAFGVPVATIQHIARGIGRDHELAVALWDTEWYEARMLTAFIDEPAQVTAAQMDRWARDFDNWAICDTLCFHLFDRTPHAWRKVTQWSGRRGEFVKRSAFALLASLSLHDKTSPDKPFLHGLRIIEREATDERNFVRKAVSWALRTTGRRNKALNAASVETARRLAESSDAVARSTGKEALRELTSPAVARRLETTRR